MKTSAEKRSSSLSDITSSIGMFLLKNQTVSIYIVVIIAVVIFSVLSPKFYTFGNVMNVTRQTAYAAIAAIGITYALISAGLDLSVGSLQAFVGLITVYVLVSTGNVVLAILAGLACGVIVGFINGLVITRLKIQDIIVTLAMQISLRGVAYLLTDGRVIINDTDTIFNLIGSGFIKGIPVPIFIMIAYYILFSIILKYFRFGRYVYAIGSNREAAITSGINYNKIKMRVYLIAGFTGASSAIILASRMNSGQPTVGIGFEFLVIAGVVLGGSALHGGVGNLVGSFGGVLLLTILRNGFVIIGMQSFWQEVITGVIIVFAVWLNSFRSKIFSSIKVDIRE